MPNRIELNLKEDHVSDGFEWKEKPSCKCGMFLHAIQDRIIFVSNVIVEDSNTFYMCPLDSEGRLYHRHELPIVFCPWCGDRVRGRKAK